MSTMMQALVRSHANEAALDCLDRCKTCGHLYDADTQNKECPHEAKVADEENGAHGGT